MRKRILKPALSVTLALVLCFCVFVMPAGAVITIPNGDGVIRIPDNADLKAIGYSNGYDICFYINSDYPMPYHKVVGKYCFSTSSYDPYPLGLYVVKGEEIYTLEHAYNENLINLDEVVKQVHGYVSLTDPDYDGWLYACSAYRFGDADLNGDVNMKDILIVQKGIAGLISFEQEGYVITGGLTDPCFLGDYNNDGKADLSDALAIQKYIAGVGE